MTDYSILKDSKVNIEEWVYGQYKAEKIKHWLKVNPTAIGHMIHQPYSRVMSIPSINDCHGALLELRSQVYGRRGLRPTINGSLATDSEYRIFQRLLDYSFGTDCTYDNLCSALEGVGITKYKITDNRNMTLSIKLDASQSQESIDVLLNTFVLPIQQGVLYTISTELTEAFNYDANDQRNKPYDGGSYNE